MVCCFVSLRRDAIYTANMRCRRARKRNAPPLAAGDVRLRIGSRIEGWDVCGMHDLVSEAVLVTGCGNHGVEGQEGEVWLGVGRFIGGFGEFVGERSGRRLIYVMAHSKSSNVSPIHLDGEMAKWRGRGEEPR